MVLNLYGEGNAKEWYSVRYDPETERVFREGTFRLDQMRTY